MSEFDLIRHETIQQIEKERNSTVLVYVHEDSLSYAHVPIFYNKLNSIGVVENLDIFLSSSGGDPDAAFKIVKMCREHCRNKLSVIVPFMAKSAATLLAIGTDEIVMGAPSELGPIDPQISDRSSGVYGATQSIRDCLDFLEDRFEKSDNLEVTSHVFMPILDKLDPFTIGMFERAVKMSKQYAELLLKNGMLREREDAEIDSVVEKLSESYYSHGYAINSVEAKNELFLNVIDYSGQKIWNSIWNLYITYYLELDRDNTMVIETFKDIENRINENKSTTPDSIENGAEGDISDFDENVNIKGDVDSE